MEYYRTMINQITATCCDLGESCRYNVEKKKPNTKDYM